MLGVPGRQHPLALTNIHVFGFKQFVLKPKTLPGSYF
jgi:hypothetical protein